MEKIKLLALFLIAAIAGSVFSSIDYSKYNFDQPENKGDYENSSVVFISLDVLRADHMPCYGYKRNTSPYMCSFAEDNIVFKDAISQGTWTLPSQMSVMTGKYPSSHGVYTRSDSLPKKEVLLPEKLPNHYSKAGFIGGSDVKSKYGFGQGFDHYYNAVGFSKLKQAAGPALNWTEDIKGSFFLFLQGYNMHEAYNASEKYRGLYTENYTGVLRDYELEIGTNRTDILGQIRRRPNGTYYMPVNGTNVSLDDRDMEYIIGRYDEEIREADDTVKKFINRLKEQGKYEDTIIVIYSSHGEGLDDRAFPGNKLSGHGKPPFHGQVNVPLMIRIPGEESKEVRGPVELIGVYPTVLDLLGIDYSKQVQGDSLLDEIESGNAEGPVFAETPRFSSRAVITRDWKYMSSGIPEIDGMLFNRSVESKRVQGEFPDIRDRMKSYLREHRLSRLKE